MTSKLKKTILAFALIGSIATGSYAIYDTITPEKRYILNTIKRAYHLLFEPPTLDTHPPRRQF